MTEDDKKIIKVTALHLNEIGYGPEGKHTRRQWRDECLINFLASKSQFESWQENCETLAKNHVGRPDFGVELTFEGGSKQLVNNSSQSSYIIDLAGMAIDMEVEASGYKFIQNADFSYVKLKGRSSFDATEFKEVSFVGAVFENANFLTTIFAAAKFSKAKFKQGMFAGAKFGNVRFDFAKFENEALFNGSEFQNTPSFNATQFGKYTDFLKAKFITSAVFRNARFQSAMFKDVDFGKSASFTESIFDGDVDFHAAKFGRADFTRVVFERQSHFLNVKFLGSVSFENATFQSVGHFETAMFNFAESKIPSFRGVKIDTTRLEFSDDTYFSRNDYTESAIKNISFLKRLSDEHGQTDQALNFNAMELRAKRRNLWQSLYIDSSLLDLLPLWPWQLLVMSSSIFKGDFWYCVVTWLYEAVSDFGRSFTKPFVYLLGLMAISYLLSIISAFEHSSLLSEQKYRRPIFSELSVVYSSQECASILSGYRAAVEYSLYRSGNFLDFTDTDKSTKCINMRLYGQEIEPWWARLFGFIKGILTAVLLFLTALGLRNKYRIG